jgi:hypothetical protein
VLQQQGVSVVCQVTASRRVLWKLCLMDITSAGGNARGKRAQALGTMKEAARRQSVEFGSGKPYVFIILSSRIFTARGSSAGRSAARNASGFAELTVENIRLSTGYLAHVVQYVDVGGSRPVGFPLSWTCLPGRGRGRGSLKVPGWLLNSTGCR